MNDMTVENRYIFVTIMILFLAQINTNGLIPSNIDTCFIRSQEPQIGCNLTLFNMDIFTSDSDLIVDIHYQIEYNDTVEIIEIRLFLSLDNNSYVQGFQHEYNTSILDNDSIEAFFSYSNAIGDPLPFDVQEGQILNVYVEIESEYGKFESNVIYEVIPIDVTRPWFFNIPAPLFIIGAIVLAITPCICLGYLVQSYSKRRSSIAR